MLIDVPYTSLIDPAKRIHFPGRQALPEVSGIYAWWETGDPQQSRIFFGDDSRPVFLTAARNLAASIEADATGTRASVLRRTLATVMTDHFDLRAARRRGTRPPLNKEENNRIS